MDHSSNYILYVDDNEDDTFMAQRALKKSKLSNQFKYLTDGQECIDFLLCEGEFSGQPHDLPLVLLLDINMPRVGGFEVLTRLRAEVRTKLLPIVMLTTSDTNSDIERAYSLGANSYITKPVDTEQFFNAIQELEIYWTLHNKPPSL